MDISNLRRRFQVACDLYNIPSLMYAHGMHQLEVIFNLPATTNSTLFLRPQSGWHVLQRPYTCYRMVYLLFKGEGVSYNETNNSIIIPLTAQVYAGQARNFHDRDHSRRGPMRDSHVKLCLAHNLTTYQRDSLETASILFSLFIFGLRSQNNCIYPVNVYLSIPIGMYFRSSCLNSDAKNCIYLLNVYLHIPIGMTWEDTHSQNMLLPTATWNWSSRVFVVGTAPPATLLVDPDYQDRLARHNNPVLDLAELSNRSTNIAFLALLLQGALDILPPFVDHWPDMECDNWGDFRRAVSFEDILRADRNLREAIDSHRRDVIVMVGRRPTLLYPQTHTMSYFTDICPYIDIYWFPNETCGLVFWWIHPGLRWHTNKSNALLVEHILQLSAIQLRIVLRKIHLVSGESIGIPAANAAELKKWVLELPITQQIAALLRKLSKLWGSPFEFQHPQDYPFSVDAEYYHGEELAQPPQEIEQGLLPVSVEVQLPRSSLSELTASWSSRFQSSAMRQTLRRLPHFHILTETQQALELQRTARIHHATLINSFLDQQIRKGRFFPHEGETRQQQWQRCWRQINFERLNKSSHPKASWYTCCWCGQQFNRVLYEGSSMVAAHTSLPCPNGAHLTKGWQLIESDYVGLFPECNLFLMFYESLEAGLVLNQKQLAAAFMLFIYQNRWHPQASYLYSRFGVAAPLIETFESSGELTAPITVFISSTRRALQKLTLLTTPRLIQWTKRYTLPEERAGRINISPHQTLFSINVFFSQPKMMIPLENFDFLGYREHFHIESVGEWYPELEQI
ncbi:hypothetical protein NQZ79_g2705 [Umbelopsis isabellina]|nr:hypothetical protein NQZ79_g2705 [Umbelopsis isabellina]